MSTRALLFVRVAADPRGGRRFIPPLNAHDKETYALVRSASGSKARVLSGMPLENDRVVACHNIQLEWSELPNLQGSNECCRNHGYCEDHG